MARIIRSTDPTQLEPFCQASPTLSLPQVQQQKADEHWLLENQADEICGRCSLWWQHTPPYKSHRIGLIGHFGARESDAAGELLAAACAALRAKNCTMAIGPMDGNTWQRYRVMTERGTAPPFLLEPENPPEWPRYFSQNGFTAIAKYFSTITMDLTVRNPRLDAVAERLSAQGVTIRAATRDRLVDELCRIYSVAAIAFQNNVLYSPIEEDEFIAQYASLKSFIQPELVLLAEHDGRTVGFLFALPDWSQAQRAEAVNTFIVKTVAVLPEYAGLGGLLVARSHEIGAALGFQRAIHALMHEANQSRRISQHYSQPLRQYALFGKPL